MTAKRVAGVLAGGATLVACGALLIPLQQAGSTGSGDAGGGGMDGSASPSPDVEQKLGVLRRPQVASDRIRIEPDSMGAVDPQPGENITESRRATFADGAVHVWPKRNGACFSTQGVSSCADAQDLAEREVLIGIYRGAAVGNGVVRLAGVAVEGVDSLTVGLSGGREVEVATRDNMFLVDLDEPPLVVRWNGPSGAKSEKLPELSAESAPG
jgi:hypothetical protein